MKKVLALLLSLLLVAAFALVGCKKAEEPKAPEAPAPAPEKPAEAPAPEKPAEAPAPGAPGAPAPAPAPAPGK
ncbi:MAG: hypothetical protein ACK415_05285 [Thermodesulfovibrionales bacterium]